LVPGIYDEQVEILTIPGSSSQQTVTIQSQPGDTAEITHLSTVEDSNYVIRIKGADHIRLRDLKLSATGNPLAVVLDLYKGAHQIDINGNRLIGIAATQNDVRQAIIRSDDSYSRSRIIQNNRIANGSLTIFMKREQNNFDYPPGTVIRNNTLTNSGYTGIFLQFHDAPVVEANRIQSNYNGIQLSSCTHDLQITKNIIDSEGGYGINLGSCDATAVNRGIIANNFVHVGGVSLARGISLTTANFFDIFYNNVNITSTHTSNGRALYVNSGNDLHIFNNIFKNGGGGYAYYISTPSAVNSSDYNNLYSSGLNFAYWNGVLIDLGALQIVSGMESHSISVDPNYLSDTDLHVSNASLNSAAIPVPEVTLDIDGQTRNPSLPDIGADEFGTSGSQHFAAISAGLTGINYSSVSWGDFDNDGDLDLLMAGSRSGGELTDIFRNDGSGIFTPLNAGLPGLTHSSVAWGDYNNDNLLDFVITGSFFGTGNFYSEIYRNDGNEIFTPISSSLPDINRGCVSWGDYNNDGKLDLIITGLVGANSISEIYRNDGNDMFTAINSGLPGVSNSSVSWGDYDSDGDLDLLLSGSTGSYEITEIYRNDGPNTFTPINANFPGLTRSSVAWGDYNEDGRLDLIISGSFFGTGNYYTEIYKNLGNDQFNPIYSVIRDIQRGTVAWGDHDNDGDLDLLLCGLDGSNPFSRTE